MFKQLLNYWRHTKIRAATVSCARRPGLTLVRSCLALAATTSFTASAKPSRILSATLASDEMLTAILAQSCEPKPCTEAYKRLVAVSRFADDPRYSNIAPVSEAVKERFTGDAEQLIKFRPDLVILASFSRPELITRLKSLKVASYLMDDLTTIEAIQRVITALGNQIEEPSAAASVVSQMRRDLETALANGASLRQKDVSVLHAYDDGTISGRGTLFDSIATAAGARNVSRDLVDGWQKLSAEALIKLDPTAIVVGVAAGSSTEAEMNKLRNIPGITKLRAWKQKRIVSIPDAELAAVSPHIVHAVTKLQQALKQIAQATADTRPE